MKKKFLLMTLFIGLFGIAWADTGDVVTSLDELSNSKMYHIQSGHGSDKYLVFNSSGAPNNLASNLWFGLHELEFG